MARPALSVPWRGLALTSLFFYPLAAAADAQVYYLMWQPRHTLELAAAFGLLTVALSLGVWAADRIASPRWAALAYVALLAVPALSFGQEILRSLPWKPALAEFSITRGVRAIAAFVALGAAAFLLARPRPARTALRGVVWLLSPVTVVVLVALVRLGWAASPPGSHPMFAVPALSGRVVAGDRPNIVVLLFDELSYTFLYRGHDIDPRYPHLAALGARSTHYHAATSPGSETLVALPGYIAGRRLGELAVVGDALLEAAPDGSRRPFDLDAADNLFRLARNRGLRTEMVGNYLPYCRMLPTSLDACRAFSLYNRASVDHGFSLLNPIGTTFMLWPHQFPTGLLKNPTYAVHQRQMEAEAESLALSPMDYERPVLRFIHFSIPHVPFVFDRNGYHFVPFSDPVAADVDAYRRQLEYVDVVVGRFLSRLDTNPVWSATTLVVLSDHEFRARVPRDQVTHVPLIVCGPQTRARADIDTTVRAEEVLRQLVAEAGSSR